MNAPWVWFRRRMVAAERAEWERSVAERWRLATEPPQPPPTYGTLVVHDHAGTVTFAVTGLELRDGLVRFVAARLAGTAQLVVHDGSWCEVHGADGAVLFACRLRLGGRMVAHGSVDGPGVFTVMLPAELRFAAEVPKDDG